MTDPVETTEDPFLQLGVDPALARAIEEEGYTEPTEVQRQAIPVALAGKDLLALAQTGTGKTAAFSLPILHRLHHHPRRGPRSIRVLILTPTRELAIQVHESIRVYGRHLSLRAAVILGGVSAVPQIVELRKVPDILVATPGRLLDLMSQGHIALDRVEIFVLDEADRMLDMGFITDVRKIVAKIPELRQTLFFSATMPKEVEQLAQQILTRPERVQASPPTSVPVQIEERIFLVGHLDKRKLLAQLLMTRKGTKRVLVFSRTKRRADTIVRHLQKIDISVAAIHSNKTQGARQNALGGFSKGKVRVLVATDIVARGIDVDDITHVINFDLPGEPESYVHRIGRTARAGAGGVAWSFCDEEELPSLREIEQILQRKLEIDEDHPFHAKNFKPLPVEERQRREGAAPGGGRKRSRGGRGRKRADSPEESRETGSSEPRSPRRSGPREARPRQGGASEGGARGSGPRGSGPRQGGSRQSGSRQSGSTQGGPKRSGTKPSGRQRSRSRRADPPHPQSEQPQRPARPAPKEPERKRPDRPAASEPERKPPERSPTRAPERKRPSGDSGRAKRRPPPDSVDDNFGSDGLFGGSRRR